MPINRLLAGSTLRPDQIACLKDAYERTLRDMT
jgi:hypothetical protein